MKVIFFLFMVTIDNHDFETMSRFNNVEYSTKAECNKAKNQIKVKKNQTLFCGESHLFFNKEK